MQDLWLSVQNQYFVGSRAVASLESGKKGCVCVCVCVLVRMWGTTFAVVIVGTIWIIYLYIFTFSNLIKKNTSDPAQTPNGPYFIFLFLLVWDTRNASLQVGLFCSFDLHFASFLYRKWDFRGFLRCFGFAFLFGFGWGFFFSQKNFEQNNFQDKFTEVFLTTAAVLYFRFENNFSQSKNCILYFLEVLCVRVCDVHWLIILYLKLHALLMY